MEQKGKEMNQAFASIKMPPPNTYILKLTENFCVHLPGKVPTKFNQWWLKFLMGITIEEIKK